MSLIRKENLNYLTTIEQFFLSLKDSGLTLSATDYQIITAWEDRGIPVEQLCRAIEIGFHHVESRSARPGGAGSLSRIRDYVEQELQRIPE